MSNDYCNHGRHKHDTCDHCEKDAEINELKEEIKLLESELAKERENNSPCYCDETSTRNCPRHQRKVTDNE